MQGKSNPLWRKKITLTGARALSYELSQSFEIDYCEIYFVDRIKEGDRIFWGCYVNLTPPHALIVENVINRIGIVVHELVHHVEYQIYDTFAQPEHGYGYQLAKQRVITWARKNISSRAPWHWPLKANQVKKEQIAFKI